MWVRIKECQATQWKTCMLPLASYNTAGKGLFCCRNAWHLVFLMTIWKTVQGRSAIHLAAKVALHGSSPGYGRLTAAGGFRFDGDGMMHVVRIKDGKASYCNRFVDTLQLQQAKLAGHPVGIKVWLTSNPPALLIVPQMYA